MTKKYFYRGSDMICVSTETCPAIPLQEPASLLVLATTQQKRCSDGGGTSASCMHAYTTCKTTKASAINAEAFFMLRKSVSTLLAPRTAPGTALSRSTSCYASTVQYAAADIPACSSRLRI